MSGNLNRSRLLIRSEALYRELFTRFICNRDGSIQISEFPKSGGSWIGDMLSDLLEIDFPRNRFPTKRASIFHGHKLQRMPLKNVIIVWRDPRDVMISWYHHTIVGNSHVQPEFVEQCRKLSGIEEDLHDVSKHLNRFVQWSFNEPYSPKFTWSDFFDFWQSQECYNVTYEAMRTQPVETLKKLAQQVRGGVVDSAAVERVVDQHSFKKKSGRATGQEDKSAFLRKGVVGDWKNYFGEQALETLNTKIGDRLAKLGYE